MSAQRVTTAYCPHKDNKQNKTVLSARINLAAFFFAYSIHRLMQYVFASAADVGHMS